MRCCSTRTPSCWPGATLRCGSPRGHARTPRAPERSCCGRTARAQACAWRFPSVTDARSPARVFLHRLFTVQSRGERTREVDWCQSAALLVRLRGGSGGRLPRPRLLRLLRRGRLRPPAARRGLAHPVRAERTRDPPRAAVHRRRPRATDRGNGAQPRPLHAQAPLRRSGARGALADRVDLRVARARCAGAARARSTRATGATSPRPCSPGRGEGLREAAEEYNRSGSP